MSGWTAVVTIAVLMVVATIGFNASLWMRHKAMAAARGGWGDADFVAALTDAGCSQPVIGAVRDALAGHYAAGLSPRPDDQLYDLLRITPDESEELVECLFRALDLPQPTRLDPEHVPELATVGDLAAYLEDRSRQLTKS